MAVAIILAGGSGSRMKSEVAKQYLHIRDKEVLYYSLKTFQANDNITEIILVTKAGDEEYCRENIVNKYGFSKVTHICPGGKERYNSVYNGLLCVEPGESHNDEIVLIHDGARPFVTREMIDESVAHIREGGSACTVAVPVKDTIKLVDEIDGRRVGVSTPDRNRLYQIQTPQTFRYKLIMKAYEKLFESEKHNITDDTMLVEQYMGVGAIMIDGAYENIKITTSEDMKIGEIFVEKFL